MVTPEDKTGAFCPHGKIAIAGAEGGPLHGLRYALKDLFDTRGHVTGCGNPVWLASHLPATANAPIVRTLAAAGATLVAKTITDELAYSLNGENVHYGTPVNPAAPERIPGGSSCGSASAVAAAAVEFAIGSDTGGSVRVPASYCGIFGARPSHGATDLGGCMPLAPSFDTVGWFTTDAALLEKLGAVILGQPPVAPDAGPFVVVEEAQALTDDATRTLLERAIERLGPVERVRLGVDLGAWMTAFRVLQGLEIWRAHGEWVRAHRPDFGPGIRERFQWIETLDAAEAAAQQPIRDAARAAMDSVVAGGKVLLWPSAPGPAPFLETPSAELERFRNQLLSLTSPAGLAGLPQVSLPAGTVQDAPVGLSLIAGRGQDMALLATARAVSERLGG